MALSAMAVNGLNVYTSGMSSTLEGGVFTVNYTLNTAATALDVMFYDATGELYDATAITDAALLTEGAHSAVVALPDGIEDGTYTWGMRAAGAATTFENVLDNSTEHYSFYLPQDVVVDNNPESPYFGQVYVCLPWVDTDGGTATTKNQNVGIYVYNAMMEPLNYMQGYMGSNVTISGKDRQSIKRMTVGPDGMVYIGGNNTEATPGVWKMNPATPNAEWTAVLDPATAATDYVKVAALEVVGNNLYTLCNISTESGNFNTYALAETGYATRTASVSTLPMTMGNQDCSIRSDRRGGFWITQHRYTADAYSLLFHINAAGTVDFAVNSSSDDALKAIFNNTIGGASYRGVMGISPDGQYLAIGSHKAVVVCSVAYDDAGVPSLTFVCETGAIGTNIDGIAFDYANNLYFASASVEVFYAYPIAKGEGENLKTVAAPARYAFTIGEAATALENTEAVKVEKMIENGQVIILRNGVRYNAIGQAL